MKKLISVLILFLAVLLALAWHLLIASANDASLVPPPSCGQQPAYSFSSPGNPFYWPSGEHAICFVVVHDAYGPMPLRENGCVSGPAGTYCVKGMNAPYSQLRVSGPLDFEAVTLFENWRSYLPLVCGGYPCPGGYP